MPIENIPAQFKGLPLADLMSGPLNAACDAQVRLALATVDFIRKVGLQAPAPGADPWSGDLRTTTFKFSRPCADAPDSPLEQVELEVPVLAIVNVPNLAIRSVDVTFDMEVRSAETNKDVTDHSATLESEAAFGWGLFSGSVKVHGHVASHQENTRSSDNSAKYHIALHASDSGMPEGLARVMDMLSQSIGTRARPHSMARPAAPLAPPVVAEPSVATL